MELLQTISNIDEVVDQELPKLADRHRDSPGSLQGPSSSYLDPSERHRSPSTVSQVCSVSIANNVGLGPVSDF